MRDKHLQIEEDRVLLKAIRGAVNNNVKTHQKEIQLLIWLKFAFYFTLIVVFYTGIYFINIPSLFILNYVLYGLASLLLAFNFAHDFSHDTIFKNKKWNNLAFISIYTIVGGHAEAWKERHISSHHFAPNVKDYDSDLQITGIIRVIPGSDYKWYHKYQYIYAPFAYTIYSLFWVFIKDFVIYFSGEQNPKDKNFYYHLSFWVQKFVYLTYILIMPILFSSQIWYVVFSGFILMHLILSLFLLFTFFMTHHVENTYYPTTDENGFINTSWFMNQIKSSNDMYPYSQTANFIFGGFNNHIAHHLFPNKHHIHYPTLNKTLYNILNVNGIQPNQTTYWGGIVSHLRLLKKMGEK